MTGISLAIPFDSVTSTLCTIMRASYKKLRPLVGFLLAWAFLNFLINLNYPAEDPALFTPLRLSPEILGLLALVGVAIRRGLPFHAAFYLPLTLAVVSVRLFRIGDTLVPLYFNREFNLYLDSQFLDDLFHLLYNTLPAGTLLTYAGLAVFLLAAVPWAVWHAFRTMHRFLELRARQALFLGLIALLTVLFCYQYPASRDGRSRLFAPEFLPRLVAEFDFILHVQGYRTRHLDVIRRAMQKAAQTPSSLDKLGGADVYLFFIESYGETVLTDPKHFAMIAPVLELTQSELKAQGFGMRSHFLTSPTFGGASWLARATVASGIFLARQMEYNLLLTSNLQPLAGYFNKCGYRTVTVMPGTQWPWPQGEFFDYQQKYYAWNFAYQGPSFGWATMPDQYVLDYIYRREIQTRTLPLFIEFVLISSHAPFHRQPPYLADWSDIGDGAIYHAKQMITFPIVWPDLRHASEAYLTAIAYDIHVLRDFIQQNVKDEALMIIMGDHQPNLQITGANRTWSVPVHIISRNPRFMDPFAARGFTAGLIPRQPPPHPGMETFLYNFLEDFSSTPPAGRSPR
ncbi:MAG: sulfatase-like hydrolase/transferase [Desulfobacterales bacterium]|nr:MAG: sulfatase-like hydrolase/transferase [Desulfobacterales bacterium]